MSNVQEFIEKVKEGTGVWAILHHGSYVGKIIMGAKKVGHVDGM